MNFIHFEKIDSTNAEALRRIESESQKSSVALLALNKTVISADEQSAGRGRMKRAFYSPAKSGIYFTAIHAPEKSLQEPAKLTAAAAVAVCRSIEEFFGVEAKIKWVNDIYVREKKVCGILAEGHLSKSGKIDAAAIGIGINVYPSDFPGDLGNKAGSILTKEFSAQNNQGMDDKRLLLAKDVSEKLFALLESEAKNQEALKEYAARSFLVGKEIQVIPVIGDEKTSYKAKVLGIDKEARLLVRLEDGSERALFSGEISIKI